DPGARLAEENARQAAAGHRAPLRAGQRRTGHPGIPGERKGGDARKSAPDPAGGPGQAETRPDIPGRGKGRAAVIPALIFDIETIPDAHGLRQLHEHAADASDELVVEAALAARR